MNKFITQLQSQLKAKTPLYIKVKVISKMPKNEIVDMMSDGTFKIKVSAQPRHGGANAELLKFLKKEIGASDVAIVSGGREKIKLIRLTK